jgi:hypothetical protein
MNVNNSLPVEKKSKDKDGPSSFKKDLLTYKNQALGSEHRVNIIGTTKSPENGGVEDMKTFFDKFLYMPYLDYASRVLIWKYADIPIIQKKRSDFFIFGMGGDLTISNNNDIRLNKKIPTDFFCLIQPRRKLLWLCLI